MVGAFLRALQRQRAQQKSDEQAAGVAAERWWQD